MPAWRGRQHGPEHGTIRTVPVVLLIAAAAILGGVIIVAIGRGGELARFPADVSPFDTEIVTAADVVLLRPPSALFGYNRQIADDALSAIARTITERDVEIATLRRQLADLQAPSGPGAAVDPQAAPGRRLAPGPRPPVIRRGPAVPPGPPPQAWSAWDPPAASSPAASSPAASSPAPGDTWAPDPDASGDAR